MSEDRSSNGQKSWLGKLTQAFAHEPKNRQELLELLREAHQNKLLDSEALAIVEGAGAAPAPTPAPAPAAAPSGSESKQAPAPDPQAQAAIKSEVIAAAPHDPTKPPLGLPHASPSVRKFARELGVPLAEVKGSGAKGRITQDDVQNFTKAVMSGTARTKAQGAAPATGGAVTGGGQAAQTSADPLSVMVSAVPSMDAMTMTWFFLVTMSLTWVTWVGMSSLAYCRLTV